MRSRLVLTAVLCLSCTLGSNAATIIHAGRLIDGRNDEPQSEMSIVIEDGKITNVARGYVEPKDGDTLVRLTEYTVMPGLMDMHTHLQSQHSKDSYTERFFMEQADYALRSTVYARVTLMAGFTTVPSAVRRTVTHQSWQNALGLPMFCHWEKNSVWTFEGVDAGGAQLPFAWTAT